jgi:hypothetical protein
MMWRVSGLAVMLACATCSNPEPAMSAPSPPTTILSAFTPLQGGDGQAIAPGGRLVTLGGRATWWEGDKPVWMALPGDVNGYGARWQPDGKALCVGLGTLDLEARTWHPEPALKGLVPDRRQRARQVAWSTDTAHVAVLVQHHRDSSGGMGKQEIAIAARDGRVRGRLDVVAVTGMVASNDRVLVARAGAKPLVLDLDAKVVAEPNLTVGHINEGAGMFAIAIPQNGLALLRPSDGGVIATWDVETNDAVPVPHGVVAVDSEGTVRVGCLHGNAIREAAKVATGQKLAIIQHVGDRIALMGGGANPVWVASFSNPCS